MIEFLLLGPHIVSKIATPNNLEKNMMGNIFDKKSQMIFNICRLNLMWNKSSNDHSHV